MANQEDTQSKLPTEVVTDEHAHKEHHKNGLPPFLMARMSLGLLKNWIVSLCLIGGIGVSVVMKEKEFAVNIACVLVILCSLMLPFAATKAREATKKGKESIKKNIHLIQDEFSNYLGSKDAKYELHFPSELENSKLFRILVTYIVQTYPGVFDKMIANPDTVESQLVRSWIVRAHLKNNHADIAPQVKDTFPNTKDLIPKVRKYVDACAERHERCGAMFY